MKYLTVNDVAEKLNIGKTSTYKLFRLKGFPCVRVGRKYIIAEDELNNYLNMYKNSCIYLKG